ncbi:hypothetical protein EMIT0P100_120179 [Pseudomonas sp. IT-P100]
MRICFFEQVAIAPNLSGHTQLCCGFWI